MKRVSTFLLTASLAAAPAAFAQPAGHDNQHAPATEKKEASSSQMSEGEIRKVDKEAKKITIKHGDLRNLGMPPMTMVFQVRDPSILDRVKPGDKINFVAEQVGGKLIVTKVEPK